MTTRRRKFIKYTRFVILLPCYYFDMVVYFSLDLSWTRFWGFQYKLMIDVATNLEGPLLFVNTWIKI